LRTELDKAGWTDKDLRDNVKDDLWKVRVAARLRRESTMTLKWIAERHGQLEHLNGWLDKHPTHL
jgi:hypothetical protein